MTQKTVLSLSFHALALGLVLVTVSSTEDKAEREGGKLKGEKKDSGKEEKTLWRRRKRERGTKGSSL